MHDVRVQRAQSPTQKDDVSRARGERTKVELPGWIVAFRR